MFGRYPGSVDATRDMGATLAFPLSVNVVANANANDTLNTLRSRERITMGVDLYYLLKKAGLILLNDQVILTLGAYKAPFTVITCDQRADLFEVGIGTDGLARFPGVTLPTTGTLSAYAPDTPVDDAAAQAAGQYYEEKTDNGSNTQMIVIAPHGGNIEQYTDTLAIAAKTALEAATPNAKTVSLWIGRGYGSGDQESYERHHITSVYTCVRLNPILDTLDTRGWTYCLSFHGQSTNSRIDIGCPAAQNTFVDGIVTDLQADAALSGVTIARSSDTVEIAGADSHNIGNRLAGHYVQFEIGPNVRASATMQAAIVTAVANAYGAL